MLLKNVKNIEKLFQVIGECKGKVDLVGTDMVLNLKSELAKYFAFSQLCADGAVGELEIRAYEYEDVARIMNFMIDGNE